MDKSSNFIKTIDANKETIKIFMTGNRLDLPVHSHEKAQFSYAEGDATFIIVEGKELFLPARHCVWIPSNMEHKLFHKYRTHSVFTYYIPKSLVPDKDFYKKIGIYPVSGLLLEMILYSVKWNGDVLKDSLGFQFISTLIMLLSEMETQSLPFSLPTTTNPRFQEILQYIQQNLHTNITVELISKKFNYSERTFSRTFQSLLGTSYFQYLKMARIIRAMEMLLRTDKNVSEIAFEAGYESIAAFSNTFYHMTRTRPTNFRELNK